MLYVIMWLRDAEQFSADVPLIPSCPAPKLKSINYVNLNYEKKTLLKNIIHVAEFVCDCLFAEKKKNTDYYIRMKKTVQELYKYVEKSAMIFHNRVFVSGANAAYIG